MPRMPYSAREKIIKSLRERAKNWSDLLKDTKLSKAALSMNIRNLIQEAVITTDVNASKRPPVTVYKINPMASSLRTAKPVYSIQEEKEPEYPTYDVQQVLKKNPKWLDQLLRLQVIKAICDQSAEAFAVISTDDDVEFELLKLESPLFKSKKALQDFCFQRIAFFVKNFFEPYGVKLSDHKIKEEIEKIRQEGLFDIGLKHHYGIKVTKKLAKLYDRYSEEIESLYYKMEKEIYATKEET